MGHYDYSRKQGVELLGDWPQDDVVLIVQVLYSITNIVIHIRNPSSTQALPLYLGEYTFPYTLLGFIGFLQIPARASMMSSFFRPSRR